jgi:hypothetical protein
MFNDHPNFRPDAYQAPFESITCHLKSWICQHLRITYAQMKIIEPTERKCIQIHAKDYGNFIDINAHHHRLLSETMEAC